MYENIPPIQRRLYSFLNKYLIPQNLTDVLYQAQGQQAVSFKRFFKKQMTSSATATIWCSEDTRNVLDLKSPVKRSLSTHAEQLSTVPLNGQETAHQDSQRVGTNRTTHTPPPIRFSASGYGGPYLYSLWERFRKLRRSSHPSLPLQGMNYPSTTGKT